MENNYTEVNAFRGEMAVREFVKLILKLNPKAKIKYPTQEQDMEEHWDVEIDDIKYDIKDNITLDKNLNECVPLEIMNNFGGKGSIFGIADLLAFKYYDTFICVERKAMIEYNKVNTKRKIVNDLRDAVGFYYRRTYEGKLDLVTLVPIDVLAEKKLIVVQYYLE
jgi:hypothetical protein